MPKSTAAGAAVRVYCGTKKLHSRIPERYMEIHYKKVSDTALLGIRDFFVYFICSV